MLEYAEALQRVIGAVHPLAAGFAPLAECAGRYLAGDVRSPIDLPPFDNSAMDGYALRAADGSLASLKIAGESRAGAPSNHIIGPGECVRIATGAMIPQGADAVVMQEDVAVENGCIRVLDPVKPWENVRFRGEDLRAGSILASAGAPVNAARLGLFAAAGLEQLPVRPRPRVAILSTGSELRRAGEALGPGQIYESNSLALAELIRQAGCTVVSHQSVPDHADATEAAFAAAFASADAVLSIGGASVGDWDLVRPTIEKLGGQLDFWRLAIRPGKPFFIGSCRGCLILGVPGNPVSAFVTTIVLALPALRALAGAADASPAKSTGILAEAFSNPEKRLHFARVVVDSGGQVRSAGVQASHIQGSLAAASGLVAVPGMTNLPPGTVVQVIRW